MELSPSSIFLMLISAIFRPSSSQIANDGILYPEEELHQWVIEQCPFLTRPTVRPVGNATDVVPVVVRFSAKRLLDLSDIQQKMVVQGFFTMQWYYLPCPWKSSMYRGSNLSEEARSLGYSIFTDGDLWQPHFWLSNAYTDHELIEKNFGNKIVLFPSQSGLMGAQRMSPGTFDTMCSFNFRLFPYDRQTCVIEVFVDSPGGIAGQVFLMKSAISLWEDTLKTGTTFVSDSDIWHLLNTSTRLVPIENDDSVTILHIVFEFQRKAQYYALSIFAPIVTMMVLQLGTLFMPNIPDKATFSITVLLALSVLQSVYFGQLPQTAQTVYIFYYLQGNMALGSAITFYSLVCMIWWSENEASSSENSKHVRIFRNYKLSMARLLDLLAGIISIAFMVLLHVVYFALVLFS